MLNHSAIVKVRNVCALVGIYYLSFWVTMPFWIVWSKIGRQFVYTGVSGNLFMHAVTGLSLSVAATVTGLAFAFVVDSPDSRTWGWVCGAIVFLFHLLAHRRWYQRPEALELVGVVVESVVPAIFALATYYFVWRRRQVPRPEPTGGTYAP